MSIPPSAMLQRSGSPSDDDHHHPPQGLLESLPSFRPAEYTVVTGTPSLVLYCTSQMESLSAAAARVLVCHLFHRPAPSGWWLRLTTRITFGPQSKFWDFLYASSSSSSTTILWNQTLKIPASLHGQLRSFFAARRRLQQDSWFDMALIGPSDELSLLSHGRMSQVELRLRQATEEIRHFDCPRYIEHHHNRQHLDAVFFMVYINGRWLYEFKLGTRLAQIEAVLESLDVLRRCGGLPGVGALAGIVLDRPLPDGGLLTSILVEFPAKGRLVNTLRHAGANSNQLIGWERRLKWCRQIVQGVSSIHGRGCVIGSLTEAVRSPIGLDGDDNAFLWSEFRRSSCTSDRAHAIPPEYHRSHLTNGQQPIPALPTTDLYQLGWLLWSIAANIPFTLCTLPLCRMVGCNKVNSCKEPHALPFLEHAPQYLNDAISACRSEDPSDRKTAHELLWMFPPATTSLTLKKSHFTRPEECRNAHGSRICCDACGAETNERHFCCWICNGGDFQLCPDCFFSRGVHCFGQDHYMRDWHAGEEANGSSEDSFWSSRAKDGYGERSVRTIRLSS
ncbi:hypothetical protein B0H66DRAFT_268619 [Apodospora peruviana]|uniref:Protein kinase domain-containing protein n=1 Tax=Apodospora peruviana TaxID=516989 RepID=A0AAE0M4S9_9PEZI|nr:hypothetical protein B0H66DRAFT_268619 [Apodospora peruviana]